MNWSQTDIASLYLVQASAQLLNDNLCVVALQPPGAGQHYKVRTANLLAWNSGSPALLPANFGIFIAPKVVANGLTIASSLSSAQTMATYLSQFLRVDRFSDDFTPATGGMYGATLINLSTATDIAVPSGWTLFGAYADVSGTGGASGQLFLNAMLMVEDDSPSCGNAYDSKNRVDMALRRGTPSDGGTQSGGTPSAPSVGGAPSGGGGGTPSVGGGGTPSGGGTYSGGGGSLKRAETI